VRADAGLGLAGRATSLHIPLELRVIEFMGVTLQFVCLRNRPKNVAALLRVVAASASVR
jgi:hypothetical protein